MTSDPTAYADISEYLAAELGPNYGPGPAYEAARERYIAAWRDAATP